MKTFFFILFYFFKFYLFIFFIWREDILFKRINIKTVCFLYIVYKYPNAYNYWCLEWLQKIWLWRVRWTLMVMSTGMNHIPKLPFYLFTHKNFTSSKCLKSFNLNPDPITKWRLATRTQKIYRMVHWGLFFCLFVCLFSSILLFSIPLAHWTVLFSIAKNFPHFLFFFTPTGRSIVNSFSALIFRLKLPGYLW